MTTGHIGNRHPGLGRFLQNRQLLVHREPTTTLDAGKHFDSIDGARHSRTPRLTPSLYLCGYVRSKRGLLQRAGTDTALARVVSVFGHARVHHAYLFANRRANRMKVLVHDGFGLWLCARRLYRGQFVWASAGSGARMMLSEEQLRALVVGLPWQRLGDLATISVL